MEDNPTTINSVDEYIEQFAPEVQEALQTLREVIQESAPGAEEKISYQMPAFALHGIRFTLRRSRSTLGFIRPPAGSASLKMNYPDIKAPKARSNFLWGSRSHMIS